LGEEVSETQNHQVVYPFFSRYHSGHRKTQGAKPLTKYTPSPHNFKQIPHHPALVASFHVMLVSLLPP
jgi:hypothetical protein